MDALVVVVKGKPLPQVSFAYPDLDAEGPGYVYVIGPVGASWVKVGSTRRLRRRLRDFMIESGNRQMGLFFALSHPLSEVVERCAHVNLRGSRLASERFTVTPELAIAAVYQAGETVTRDPTLRHPRVGWNRAGEGD